jgi:uncharacterized YigZ family protein
VINNLVSTASYSVPAQGWQIELEIKRSKFLTFAGNAANRDLAEQFIRLLRSEHPQASHVCWAYIAGSPDTTVRSMSDDGEPNGTAGMPMLKVLQHSGLGDIVVAVVRYFGGTKLGTGGLQRAYSDAVSAVLKDLPLNLKVSRTRLSLVYDYAYEGAISRLLGRYDVAEIHTDYAQQIATSLAVATAELQDLQVELINTTSGNIAVKILAG